MDSDINNPRKNTNSELELSIIDKSDKSKTLPLLDNKTKQIDKRKVTRQKSIIDIIAENRKNIVKQSCFVVLSLSSHIGWGLAPVICRYLQNNALHKINVFVLISSGYLIALIILIIQTIISKCYKQYSVKNKLPTERKLRRCYTCEDVTYSTHVKHVKEVTNQKVKIQPQKKLLGGLAYGLTNNLRTLTKALSASFMQAFLIQLMELFLPFLSIIASKKILKEKFPKCVWPTLLLMSVGALLCIIPLVKSASDSTNLIIGMGINLLSMIFAVMFRIQIRTTEKQLVEKELIYQQYLTNIILPLIISLFYNYKNWAQFYLFTYQEWMLLIILALVSYTFAMQSQIQCTRFLGNSFHSSLQTIRLISAIAFSQVILGVTNITILEWCGIVVVCVGISFYLQKNLKK